MATQTGMVTPAQILTLLDAWGAWFKRMPAALGLGLSSETTTLSKYAQAAKTAVLGDGSTTYGLGLPDLQGLLGQPTEDLIQSSRYDLAAGRLRSIFGAVEANIRQNLPSYYDANGNRKNWSFASSRAIDALLTRANAHHPSSPAKPTGSITLTATTNGSLPTVAAGSAPYVVLTHIGASREYESLPSAEATRVAIAAPNSAYNVAVTGTVPTGVTAVGVYRGYYGGASGTWYYDKDVEVTAGAAYPTIKITAPDVMLRTNAKPPSWISALALPEEAIAFALAFSILAQQPGQLPRFQSNGMLSPYNVAAGPVNDLPILANTDVTALFAQWVATAITYGSVQLTNDYTQDIQGFAGAANGLQARVTATLNASATISAITYSYYDASNPTTLQTNGSLSGGSKTLTAAVGDTVSLAIPAGRLVTAVTALTVSGAATGTFVIEALPLRTL